MNKYEINEFIEHMGKTGDVWTYEMAEAVYKKNSLEEALAERTSQVAVLCKAVSEAINA